VEAFRATLEEAASASLLLHVIDAHSEERPTNIARVDEVLLEIGALELPTLMVFNKIDLIENSTPRLERDDSGRPCAVWLSAQTGEGCELLFEALIELLGSEMVRETIVLPPTMGRLRAMLYSSNAVVSERQGGTGEVQLDITLPKTDFLRLLKAENLTLEELRKLSGNHQHIA
jgi:GTP-binding protein HflX